MMKSKLVFFTGMLLGLMGSVLLGMDDVKKIRTNPKITIFYDDANESFIDIGYSLKNNPKQIFVQEGAFFSPGEEITFDVKKELKHYPDLFDFWFKAYGVKGAEWHQVTRSGQAGLKGLYVKIAGTVPESNIQKMLNDNLNLKVIVKPKKGWFAQMRPYDIQRNFEKIIIKSPFISEKDRLEKTKQAVERIVAQLEKNTSLKKFTSIDALLNYLKKVINDFSNAIQLDPEASNKRYLTYKIQQLMGNADKNLDNAFKAIYDIRTQISTQQKQNLNESVKRLEEAAQRLKLVAKGVITKEEEQKRASLAADVRKKNLDSIERFKNLLKDVSGYIKEMNNVKNVTSDPKYTGIYIFGS